jgi:hypothetical protein
MNRLLKIMYATTAALEQAAIVWETMSQAEKQATQAMQAPQPVRQIGFAASKANGNKDLQESSPSTLDPARTVPTL